MQFNAKDGSKHPSQMKAFEASQKPAAAPAPDAGAPMDQPKAIQDDPQAMQLIDPLKQMGYGPDDVEMAMGGNEAAEPDHMGGAPGGAPLQIPGM